MRYLVALLVLFSSLTLAAEDMLSFRDPAQQQQYQRLTQELRCPKCQNSSIADSGSVIASDMRQKVYQLLREGQSEQQIIDFMVVRYGHFVSYEPPLTPLTWLLWGAPLAIVVLGGVLIYRRTHHQIVLTEPDVPLQTPRRNTVAGWRWIPGIALAAGIAALLMAYTGNPGQVQAWQKTASQTDRLLQQYAQDPEAAKDPDFLSRLALGLRTRLQSHPEDVNGWMQLGRIGAQMKNAQLAIQAFDRAYTLAPDSQQAELGLAEVLTLSSRTEDNQRAGELLKTLILNGHTTLPVVNLLALNAQQLQRYDEALMAWGMVLKLLPEGDVRREPILANMEQLRKKAVE
ncbi:cytochrome c biogenesis protein CcmH [Enterobacteriaceae bacterium 89]|nr:cytochrome c biogenesis protein CcmH [Enterobacteriaceae bacterium 89]